MPIPTTARFALATLPFVSGCVDHATTIVRGNGVVIEERRDLAPLSELSIDGELDVRVHVIGTGALAESRGPETQVFLEGSENLLEYVETTVEGDRLSLRYADGVRLDPRPTIEIRIGRLEAIRARGKGHIVVDGVGAGDHAPGSLLVDATGSVDLRVEGEVEELEVEQTGSGTVDLSRLFASKLAHTADGSGECRVHVRDEASIEITGSGVVVLDGPVTDVREKISGSGRLRRADPKVTSNR